MDPRRPLDSYDEAMVVEPLAVPSGAAALDVLPRLAEALAGGRPVAPYAASGPPPGARPGRRGGLPGDLAMVLGTSGSTRRPKRALLTVGALHASARATRDRLGGAGQWLLALPAHHIAGIQVLVRSLDAETTPVALERDGPFTPAGFAAAAARLDPGARHYTALVPAQVARLLDEPAGVDALTSFDAVLVGGAATPPRLRHRARAAGVSLIRTYGSSETAGGCVYAGRALRGVRVAVDPDGRVHLGGATVAEGYLGEPKLTAAVFTTDSDGVRWFRTDDVGRIDATGALHVEGRLDDVIITGGLKVAPQVVEDAVAGEVPGVRDVLAVGVPDPEWGQLVGALVVLDPDVATQPLTVEDVRERLRGTVPSHVLPRRLRTVDSLPERGPGKPDRAAAAALLA
jgi:o-succinylbenzoate---CoA ligase